VSGDVSPHPGIDAPGRHDGGDPGGRRQGLAEPSLARVLGTTLRLWWRRRVLRVADGARIGAARWTALIVVVLVVAAAGTAIGVAQARPAPAPRLAVSHRPDPVAVRTAANEQSAAAWVVAQVAPGTVVGCDPGMCVQLQSAGLAATQDAVLQPGGTLPAGAVVVATPALRASLSAQLTASAAETLASFGAGQEQVQVVLTAVTTTTAFAAAAKHALAASASAGRALDHNARLHMSGALRHVLTGGDVDMRLLVLLQRLLAAHSVHVVGFGDTGPGATWPAQLRSVTIDGFVQGSGKHQVSDLAAVLKLLRSQRAPYRASLQEVPAANGEVTLVIQVPAPSPL